MGLRSLTLPTSNVKVADGVEFSVRGVSVMDAVFLYSRHAGEMTSLFEQYVTGAQKRGNVTAADVLAISRDVAAGTPVLMGELIALASGSRPERSDEFADDVAMAMSFPLAAQMDALQKIAVLTFTSEMPPGKFLAVVMAMAQGTTAALSTTKG